MLSAVFKGPFSQSSECWAIPRKWLVYRTTSVTPSVRWPQCPTLCDRDSLPHLCHILPCANDPLVTFMLTGSSWTALDSIEQHFWASNTEQMVNVTCTNFLYTTLFSTLNLAANVGTTKPRSVMQCVLWNEPENKTQSCSMDFILATVTTIEHCPNVQWGCFRRTWGKIQYNLSLHLPVVFPSTFPQAFKFSSKLHHL